MRYITNKPNLSDFGGHFEGTAGGTRGGAPNGAFNATINVPIIKDKLAVRAVIYDDHRGGYIDNVPSTFTRSDSDTGNYYFNNGNHALPPAQQSNLGSTTTMRWQRTTFNPVDYTGGAFRQVADQRRLGRADRRELSADGGARYFRHLSDRLGLPDAWPAADDGLHAKLQQGRILEHRVDGERQDRRLPEGRLYRGLHDPHIETQQDYTNYSRTGGGMYYQCTGGSTGWGNGAPFCYSPVAYWHDKVRNTHLTNEVRLFDPRGQADPGHRRRVPGIFPHLRCDAVRL